MLYFNNFQCYTQLEYSIVIIVFIPHNLHQFYRIKQTYTYSKLRHSEFLLYVVHSYTCILQRFVLKLYFIII